MTFYLFLNLILFQKERSDMTRKYGNSTMAHAKMARNDEFYTQLTDIEQELVHYRNQFKGKVVYCNCDDPTESEFYRYFHLNFHFFGMKKLLATHYDEHEPTYALVYEGGTGEESDNDYNSYDKKIPLKENGDFRSSESIEFLKQADMVVTNPPFSLFREFVAQLVKYKKQFIIWGNLNSVITKEIFPLIQDQKIWIGFTANKSCVFRLADNYKKWDKKITAEYHDGHKYGKVPSITVFTNLPIKKPTDRVILWNHYSKKEFPTYVNYPAFECSKLAHLPIDKEIDTWIDKDRLSEFKTIYKDDIAVKEEKNNQALVHIKRPIFGVPITFLKEYNPSSTAFPKDNLAVQFKIIGTDIKSIALKLGIKPMGKDFCDLYKRQGGRGHYTASMHNLAYISADGKAKKTFSRILIRARTTDEIN